MRVLLRHQESPKHQLGLQFKQRGNAQPAKESWGTCSSRQNACWYEFSVALLKSGIPIEKLENQHLRQFLEKWVGLPFPDASTIRNTYARLVNCEIYALIREEIGLDPFQILVDETADSEGRKMATLILVPLREAGPSKPRVINMDEIPRADGINIANFVGNSLALFWAEGLDRGRVIAYVTDGAYYMMTAYDILRTRGFDKMMHMKCLDHRLHRVAETVRTTAPIVDTMVASVKQVFNKAPIRQEFFHDHAPGIRLPPRPSTVRWGTWLEAVFYYNVNFGAVGRVMNLLPDENVVSVMTAKEVFTMRELRPSVRTISRIYPCLTEAIVRLGGQGLSLRYSLGVMNQVSHEIQHTAGVHAGVRLKMERTIISPYYQLLLELDR